MQRQDFAHSLDLKAINRTWAKKHTNHIHRMVNLVAHPENADAALLASLKPPSISLVGTSIVTPLRSLALVLSLALSAELCGRVPSWDLERPQDLPVGCGTGGAEGDRRNEVLVVWNPEGRVPGIERAEWDMDRRFARELKRIGGEIPTATR